MKRRMALMSIMNHEPINFGKLITGKYQIHGRRTKTSLWAFCIVNELCMLVGVQNHPDDEMISMMLPINQNAMSRIPTNTIDLGG